MLAVAHVLGLMMAFFAVTFVMPIACSLIVADGIAIDFVAAAAINVLVGLAIAIATRQYKRELKARDGFFVGEFVLGVDVRLRGTTTHDGLL
jgi:trk system potassium uptake protein TrkH